MRRIEATAGLALGLLGAVIALSIGVGVLGSFRPPATQTGGRATAGLLRQVGPFITTAPLTPLAEGEPAAPVAPPPIVASRPAPVPAPAPKAAAKAPAVAKAVVAKAVVATPRTTTDDHQDDAAGSHSGSSHSDSSG
jgi:hypothetical protein